MFIGAINQDVRAILYEIAKSEQRDIPVYVGCSGNFTVERVLAKTGITNLNSNDVSLYSCYLGNYLAGKNMCLGIADMNYYWLKDYLKPGIPCVATLLLCSEMFNYMDREGRYYQRMANAYRNNFDVLHQRTAEKVERALDGLEIKTFFAGDVLDFIKNAPGNILAISFPPTYKGGYERLYKKFDRVFTWDKPEYTVFDNERFEEFTAELMKKRYWITLRDERVPALEQYLIGRVQTGLRSRPVFL